MFEEGGVGLVFAAVEEGGDGGDGARFADLAEEGAALTDVVAAKGGAGGGVGAEGCGGVVEEFGVEEGEGVFEGVGFWARDCAFDGGCVEAVRDEAGDEEVDGVFETAGIVAGVLKEEPLFCWASLLF